MSDTIRRANHGKEHPYFLMSRETAQDRTLSFEARGVLVYLLSKPADWSAEVSDLKQKCGRDKVYGILNELIAKGYIQDRVRSRGERGKWVYTDYIVYETPGPIPVIPAPPPPPENPPLPDKPYTVGPYTENQDIIHNTEGESTEAQKTTDRHASVTVESEEKEPEEAKRGFSQRNSSQGFSASGKKGFRRSDEDSDEPEAPTLTSRAKDELEPDVEEENKTSHATFPWTPPTPLNDPMLAALARGGRLPKQDATTPKIPVDSKGKIKVTGLNAVNPTHLAMVIVGTFRSIGKEIRMIDQAAIDELDNPISLKNGTVLYSPNEWYSHYPELYSRFIREELIHLKMYPEQMPTFKTMVQNLRAIFGKGRWITYARNNGVTFKALDAHQLDLLRQAEEQMANQPPAPEPSDDNPVNFRLQVPEWMRKDQE